MKFERLWGNVDNKKSKYKAECENGERRNQFVVRKFHIETPLLRPTLAASTTENDERGKRKA